MPHMRQGNLAAVAYGVVLLGLRPPPEWVRVLTRAADRHLMMAGADEAGGTAAAGRGRINRISLGKLLYAAHRLPGAERAYARWRSADWIGAALEMYGGQ